LYGDIEDVLVETVVDKKGVATISLSTMDKK
jgi:hypothetical protein